MTHNEAIEMLSARVDGELTPDQEQVLDTWLRDNPDGKIIAEAFRLQDAEVRRTFEERREAADITAERVAVQLIAPPSPATSPAPRPRKRSWWALLPPITAVAAIAFVAFVWLRPHHQVKMRIYRGDVAQLDDALELNESRTKIADLLTPRAKQVKPEPAAAKVGDRIVTKAGEKRRVRLPDESVLYLNQNTTLALVKDRHVKLESGEIFVEAKPAGETLAYFEVETAQRKVVALGTKFAVSAADKSLSLLVTQGSVRVDGAAEPVFAGQTVKIVGEKLRSAEVQPARRASHDLDWTRDLMIAADSPLVPAGKYDGGALVAFDPYGQEAKLSLVNYHVDVHIEDGFARTTIDQIYFNHENMQMEGTFYFPLPPDASLSRLAMYVANGETCSLMEGGMAERDYARQTYEKIRYQRRDPALLEWVDGSLFKMRVFPLEARQEKRIVLSYSQKLPVLYGRTSYRFPTGHSLNRVQHWSFAAVVKGGSGLSAASPSHPTMKIAPRGLDLVLGDKADNVKIDRDVVLELTDQRMPMGESVRWSSADFEGAKYVMLRYRPELETKPKRERRDWVFLFEASGARDPLVARAQVEVIRALLNNAEHDDTFALLTAGTRIHKFSDTPQLVTAENVAKAIDFLEKTHLIGALNLEQALIEAEPFLTAGTNAHLVHVGGGVATLGEQRSDKLIPRIPSGTRFVGVAVGKRFSPAFMKVAAEKTGGFFTQINPDEPIAWRGFELASTLNTPRLLNIELSVAAKPQAANFLPFTNALSHGEELAAVARIDGEMPASITIHGNVDGVSFDRTIDLKDIAPNAGYLPRTWAKLEIDRLLAENPGEHRQRIIDLSKAMYVMTPFTSLLVLENEAMYKEFKVDRGRKDHWAMYPCPEKIPVVYVPDPNQPRDRNAPEFTSQKPHENVVLQTVLTRNPPRYLNWPGQNNDDTPVRTAGQQHWALETGKPMVANGRGEFSPRLEMFNGERLEKAIDELDLFAVDGRELLKLREMDEPSERKTGLMLDPARFNSISDRSSTMPQKSSLGLDWGETSGTYMNAENLFRVGNIIITGNTVTQDNVLRRQHGLGRALEFGYSDLTPDVVEERLELLNESEDLRQVRDGKRRFWGNNSASTLTYERLSAALGDGGPHGLKMASATHFNDLIYDPTAGVDPYFRIVRGSSLVHSHSGATREMFRRSGGANFYSFTAGVSIAWDEYGVDIASDKNQPMSTYSFGNHTPRKRIDAVLNDRAQGPAYYGRPSFSNQERVFSDLASYAPGMSSSIADVRAVLEAEAAQRSGNRKGSIDPAARARIESARTAEWRSTIFKDNTGADFTFYRDGQGRYAYERRVNLGLIERVVCDGSTILHLYPELGIGARRKVSRFHRQELFELFPDVLPPADDLVYGANVKMIDANTVAIVPLPPVDAEISGKPRARIEIHLVFNGNRFAERRMMLMPKSKILAREVYEPAGPVSWFALMLKRDKEDKKELSSLIKDAKAEYKEVETEVARDKREEKPAAAPDLKPDVSSFVILPLPLRSREIVYRKYEIDPNRGLTDGENACFEYLNPEAALELLACEFAANNGTRVTEVSYYCFTQHGDKRPGFYTLMQSCNDRPTQQWSFREMFKEMVENGRVTPLMNYLALAFDNDAIWWQRQTGVLPGPKPASNFLDNLFAFRALTIRWQGNPVSDRYLGSRSSERERAVAFARQHADNVWGLCTLGMISDRTGREDFRRSIADAWSLLSEKSGGSYHARYQQALNNLYGDRKTEARTQFRKLFEETFKLGILPPIDSTFRSAFTDGDGREWLKLMHESAQACIKAKHRPVVVMLAWQCRQLGDHPLADELLALALDRSQLAPRVDVITTLAAIEYLWAINSVEHADRLVAELLQIPELQKEPMILRLASKIAEKRGQTLRRYDYLEQALDGEYPRMPEVFNVEPIRRDYQALLDHYEWLANASKNLKAAPPADLLARTVRAADRWRSLDSAHGKDCVQAAKILRMLGGPEAEPLAWDFLTTLLAMKPNESGPWLGLAESATQEGELELADKCYESAFAAEPTNAQILWDRAKLLERRSEIAESRKLMKQLAETDWQPRFLELKTQAREKIGK